MKKPPSLRNNNGSLQVRVRVDGKDAFINRLGRWSDPVAVARAQAISAQIWSDYQQGTFERSLTAYQPLINGKEVGLLEALRVRAETKRQAAAIYAYRLLQRYGQPIRNRSDAEAFLGWLRAEGLSDCTIAGLMTHYRQCSGGNRHLFSHKLKRQRRSVQSDVLSVDEIQAVLADLKGNEPWYYPLFLLWLSTGMRNAEIRGLTWDCIRWEEGEVQAQTAALRAAGCATYGFTPKNPCSQDTFNRAIQSGSNDSTINPIGSLGLEVYKGVNLISEWTAATSTWA